MVEAGDRSSWHADGCNKRAKFNHIKAEFQDAKPMITLHFAYTHQQPLPLQAYLIQVKSNIPAVNTTRVVTFTESLSCSSLCSISGPALGGTSAFGSAILTTDS